MSEAPISQFRWANLLTYAAIAAGAVGLALTADAATRSWAGAGIALAIAFDLFDGRFASWFTRTDDDKQFGVEIDSLSDVISFGVAPPLCLLRVSTAATTIERSVLLAAALFYLLCIVTRLAHFNVYQANTGGFIGLPSNAAALACAILLFWEPDPGVIAVVLVAAGLATVGGFRIRRPTPIVLYALLASALAVAGLHVMRLLAA
jgi:CDP-diacylglycerol--serine O-phosphatidyltransferase